MQNFSPFPLRARGSLEIFDAAIKLYKQYFWVLLGWSAIASCANLLGSFAFLVAPFLAPLAAGAVACCVAAAVRGQSVDFGQCWRFSQPRYWQMLLMHILTLIIAFLVSLVLGVVFVGAIFGGVFALQSSPLSAQIGVGVLAFVIFGSILTIAGTVFFSWMSLVPIVICMEEDKQGTAALGRAFEILRGHWLRITALMAVVGLAMLVLFAILGGGAALFVGVGQIGDLIQGRGEALTAFLSGIFAVGLVMTILAIAATPLYYLILTVFYLDVRVRQEALDLEWTAHVTAPVAPVAPVAPEYSASEFQPLTPPGPFSGSFGTRPLSDISTNQTTAPPSAFEPLVVEPPGSTPAADAADSGITPSDIAPSDASTSSRQDN